MIGSAFVVKRDGESSILLSSAHTFFKMKAGDVVRVRRMVPEGGVQQLRSTIMFIDEVLDVSMLKVPGLMTVEPLEFAPSIHPVETLEFVPNSYPGQGAIAIGYCDPDDLFKEMCFSRMAITSPGHVKEKGTVLKSDRGNRPLHHVKLTCVATQGMSGGPVISSAGVIGMIDSGSVGNLNAVAPESIREFLKTYLNLPPENDWTLIELIDLV